MMMKNKLWSDTKKGRKDIRKLRDYHLIGNSYISEIERCKSNNSRCHGCDKRIGKNTLRGIHTRLGENMSGKKFNMRFVYCSECSIKMIKERISELRKLNKFMKDKKRTRKASYEKEHELQLKDELLVALEDNPNRRKDD